jgi:low affinity Fe/Cu permease
VVVTGVVVVIVIGVVVSFVVIVVAVVEEVVAVVFVPQDAKTRDKTKMHDKISQKNFFSIFRTPFETGP